MDRIPIIKMAEFLLVSIQVDMHDKLALTLQDDLTNQIVKSHARGVLIDISSLEIVDSFIGRMLANIAAMSKVLDAQTVLVGMRPAVRAQAQGLRFSLVDQTKIVTAASEIARNTVLYGEGGVVEIEVLENAP